MSEPERETTEQTDASDLERSIDETTEAVAVQASELPELEDGPSEGTASIAHLMDVPVRVTVEVGRAEMALGELAKLGPGALVELDREAHEPADLLVNGKVVARGEIVTVDDCYALRITSTA